MVVIYVNKKEITFMDMENVVVEKDVINIFSTIDSGLIYNIKL